jgi:hypothetical protein
MPNWELVAPRPHLCLDHCRPTEAAIRQCDSARRTELPLYLTTPPSR